LAIWLILVLVLALVKANRNPRAWLILIPLLAINLLWTVLKKITPLQSPQLAVFEQLFVSLTIGISVVLLFGHKIGNRNRFVTFLLAAVLMAAVGIAGALSYSGLAFSPQVFAFAIAFAVIASIMLLAFVFAGCCCRKRYSNLRFMLWLALSTVVVCMVILLGYFVIAMTIMSTMGGMSNMWIRMLLQISVMGLVLGGCLYVILLPFMILAFKSGFYRERFFACFRLPSMVILKPNNIVTAVEERNDGNQTERGTEFREPWRGN